MADGQARAESDDAARTLAQLFLQHPDRFADAGKELSKANCSVDIPITGSSMGRSLPDGTVIRVALGDGASCRPGDVVVFQHAEGLIAHRALAAARRHFITRGDARIAPDQPVAFARVLGRVTAVIGSSNVLQPPAMPPRHWLFQLADVCAVNFTVRMLQLSPSLAGGWISLITWMERRASVALRVARRFAPTRRRAH